MARAHDDGIVPASFKADVDLSGACVLYRFARAASTQDQVAAATGGSNPGPLGVFQGTASSGQAIGVKTLGHTVLTGRSAGCDLTIGNLILCASDSVAQSASAVGQADNIAYGRWLGPTITSGSAYGEAILFMSGASILARS